VCFTAPPPLPQLAVNNCNQRPSEATETSLTNPHTHTHTHTHHDRPLCTVLRVQNSVQTPELYYKLDSSKRSQSPFPKTAKAQQWWLVAGLSPRRSGLDTGPLHVRFAMNSGIEIGFSLSESFQQCSKFTFTHMFLLPEEQWGRAGESSINRGALDNKPSLSL